MHKRVLASLLAASVLAAPLIAGASEPAPRHKLTVDDIMALVSLRGLTCSRDGHSAAWVATSVDAKIHAVSVCEVIVTSDRQSPTLRDRDAAVSIGADDHHAGVASRRAGARDR